MSMRKREGNYTKLKHDVVYKFPEWYDNYSEYPKIRVFPKYWQRENILKFVIYSLV